MKRATEAQTPTEVRFPKGRYYLDADIDTDKYAKITNDALAMARAEQVILNGSGSEIIIRTPPTGFLALYACKDIIVRDNHIEDGRELIPGAIEVSDDCGAVDVRDNTLRPRRT